MALQPENAALIVHPNYQHTLCVPGPVLTTWDKLPAETLHHIASLLTSAEDLRQFEGVSQDCRRACRDDNLWKKLCINKFHVSDLCDPPSWKELYRFNYEIFYKILLSQANQSWSMQQYPQARGHGFAPVQLNMAAFA